MLVGGSEVPIVGHPYADPVDYLRTVEFVTGCFRPTRIVVHHCGQPEPGAAADGLCLEHMLNLRSYYCGLGWKKGPHFDDDQCWPFTPLAMRGIINASGVGIEMLGDHDDEDPWSGRGLAVLKMTRRLIRALEETLGLGREAIRLLRDDPQTSSRQTDSERAVSEVHARLNLVLGLRSCTRVWTCVIVGALLVATLR
jgi:hypothetical protein